TLLEYRFRYSIFPNSPPSDPPPAMLRLIDRSRSENRPRRDDQQPQIASSSPISTSARSAIQPRPRMEQQQTASPPPLKLYGSKQGPPYGSRTVASVPHDRQQANAQIHQRS
ncbi:hypothetical protein ACLOJK_024361, partial [Asimina triloba]